MEENVCSICLEDMGEGENNIYRLDPCGHMYHTSCALDWFRSSGSSACPNCRDPGDADGFFPFNNYRVRIKLWKQIGRRKDCPIVIKRKLDRLKTAKGKLEHHERELIEFRKNNKEVLNMERKLKNKKWRFLRAFRRVEREIDSVPVIMLVQELRKVKRRR
jgi:hypothetical protein